MILKLYIRNLWEFASLVWSGTSPRETCGQNLSLFLGQEVIAHRWNLQWGPAVAPPRLLRKGPCHGLHSIIMSVPQALKDAASGWPLFFFLDCFHFSMEDWPLRSAGIGVSLDLAGEREKEVHGGLQNWITPPPWPLASKNRLLCSGRQGSPSFSGSKQNKTTFLQAPLWP